MPVTIRREVDSLAALACRVKHRSVASPGRANESHDRLRRGDVRYRFVLDLSDLDAPDTGEPVSSPR